MWTKVEKALLSKLKIAECNMSPKSFFLPQPPILTSFTNGPYDKMFNLIGSCNLEFTSQANYLINQ